MDKKITKRLEDTEKHIQELFGELTKYRKGLRSLYFDLENNGIKLRNPKDCELMKYPIDNDMGVTEDPIEYLAKLARDLEGERASYISRECIIWAIKRALRCVKKVKDHGQKKL